MHCVGLNNRSQYIYISSQKSAANLVILFRNCSGVNFRLEHFHVPKNLFPSACYYLHNRIALPKMHKIFPFGENIAFGDSYLHRLFCYSQLSKQHSEQTFAAGAIRSDIDKEHVYCYMIEQGPKSCLLGPFTGLLFFRYVFFHCFPFSFMSSSEASCFAL